MKSEAIMWGLSVLFSVLAVRCSGPEAPRPVLVGEWGGEHVVLSVTPKGATVEFDCATGATDEVMMTDEKGRLDVKGTYTQERGGPVDKDKPPASQPARYTGSVNGNDMELTVVFEDGSEYGPFRLRFGERGRVVKCR